MKSIFDPSRFYAISTAAVLVSLLSACGQKGPLFLPPKSAPAAAATTPAPTAPTAPVPTENTIPASK